MLNKEGRSTNRDKVALRKTAYKYMNDAKMLHIKIMKQQNKQIQYPKGEVILL